MSDHSSLVATFREKLRPSYYSKSSGTNGHYIKENVYFNGIALKESLLYDNNEYPETQTQKRILFSCNNKPLTYTNSLEKGCFIYQNPTSQYDENNLIQQFTNMSLINELSVVNSNYIYSSLDSDSHKLVKYFNFFNNFNGQIVNILIN